VERTGKKLALFSSRSPPALGLTKRFTEMISRQFSFVGSATGRWTVRKQSTLVGEPLESVQAIEVLAGLANSSFASWVLSGITSNERYVNRDEKKQLVEK
jgi:hypothetical protein